MAAAPLDDTIRFEEAGATFEIFGPMSDGARIMAITDAHGRLHGFEASGMEDAIRQVDGWIAAHVPADAPGRFRGFRYLIWLHEGRYVEEREIATRGRFLEIFDDGSSPADLDRLVEHLQCCGDRVVELRDGDGKLLLECRDDVRRELQSFEMDAHEGLDVRMSGVRAAAHGG